MPKPVCPKCQRFYRPKRNGTAFIENMPIGNVLVPAGTEAPHLWKPYKLWMGDLWECLGCGNEIVVGHASSPIAEHYQSNFCAEVLRLKPTITVNDC